MAVKFLMKQPGHSISTPILVGVAGCFLLSGFAAMLYQMAWMRQFSTVFGTSETAVATVLSAYMGGLALGAGLAGRLVQFIRRKGSHWKKQPSLQNEAHKTCVFHVRTPKEDMFVMGIILSVR